jgi:chemotaxis protein MotA
MVKAMPPERSATPEQADQLRQQRFAPALVGAAIGAAFYYLVVLGVLYRYFPDYFIGRVMSSWVNLFSIMAFCSAMTSLLSFRREVRREARGFDLQLLPDGEDVLLLPDDALECRRKIRSLDDEQRDWLPVRLLSTAVRRARASWSAQDVADAVRNEADLMQAQTDSRYATIRYLAWTIPPIGFIGTVLGIGEAITALTIKTSDTGPDPLSLAAEHLHVAFDTTFLALVLSLVLMFFLSRVEAEEDVLLTRATQWCLHRFVNRMHVVQELEA